MGWAEHRVRVGTEEKCKQICDQKFNGRNPLEQGCPNFF